MSNTTKDSRRPASNEVTLGQKLKKLYQNSGIIDRHAPGHVSSDHHICSADLPDRLHPDPRRAVYSAVTLFHGVLLGKCIADAGACQYRDHDRIVTGDRRSIRNLFCHLPGRICKNVEINS